MNVDVRLLEKCPLLTDYEKGLIERIDIDHETQASVAKSDEKSPATISIQHKKTLEKFTGWIKKREESKKTLPQQDFDRQVFKMLNSARSVCASSDSKKRRGKKEERERVKI